MKTLIVDDDIVSRKKMETLMSVYGETVSVNSGSTAIVAFSKASRSKAAFDLITLDISMPDLNGEEVLARVRSIENDHKIPKEKRVKIIMVTAKTDEVTVLSCLQTGCNAYLVKPFDAVKVKQKLNELGFC